MTIEIADRLIKLRKEKGLSQEELAEKLGLSRQAVSKWERAEASPDTDNLICLAKLYGVSLDELLNTEDDIETIVEEQVKEEPKVEKIDPEQTTVIDKDTLKEEIEKNFKEKECKEIPLGLKVCGVVEGALYLCALIAFILMGFFINGAWAWAWIVFFVPEIGCSLVRAILKKEFTEFNYVFVVLFTYFFINMALPISFIPTMNPLWHPLWVLFITIPVFYIITDSVDKLLGHKKPKDDCCKK